VRGLFFKHMGKESEQEKGFHSEDLVILVGLFFFLVILWKIYGEEIKSVIPTFNFKSPISFSLDPLRKALAWAKIYFPATGILFLIGGFLCESFFKKIPIFFSGTVLIFGLFCNLFLFGTGAFIQSLLGAGLLTAFFIIPVLSGRFSAPWVHLSLGMGAVLGLDLALRLSMASIWVYFFADFLGFLKEKEVAEETDQAFSSRSPEGFGDIWNKLVGIFLGKKTEFAEEKLQDESTLGYQTDEEKEGSLKSNDDEKIKNEASIKSHRSSIKKFSRKISKNVSAFWLGGAVLVWFIFY